MIDHKRLCVTHAYGPRTSISDSQIKLHVIYEKKDKRVNSLPISSLKVTENNINNVKIIYKRAGMR